MTPEQKKKVLAALAGGAAGGVAGGITGFTATKIYKWLVDRASGPRMVKKAAMQVQKPPPPAVLLKKNFSVNFTTPYASAMPDGRPAPANIGHAPGTRNPIDGKPWEVVVPGMQMALSGIKVDKIVGVVTERTGDHVLVGVPIGMSNQKQFQEQLNKFIKIRKRTDPSARFVAT